MVVVQGGRGGGAISGLEYIPCPRRSYKTCPINRGFRHRAKFVPQQIVLGCNNEEANTRTCGQHNETKNKQKQTPWPLVHKRTIPTERPPLVTEF
jgi:hypothetical protein